MQSNEPDPASPLSSFDELRGNAVAELLARALESNPSGPDLSAWVPPDPEQLSKLLPGYDVQKFIARGGMGAVYRGVQTSLGRVVAIKILPPALQNAEQNYAERFKQEARAMAQLNHPGIVAVHDCGELLDGTLYFVMEFVEGTDVARMVAAEGRLPSAHAMAITAHVCDALQYAHEHGVVHRDIKPANIMVGYDGRVKVADFGLAKSSVAGETGLTRSGMIMGTLHFMAPEALTLGTTVDHRADIYAVGVMLYQMLTGKLPQGLFEMPSLQVAGLDPRFDGIISHALRESREQRYQEIKEMRLDLDSMMTQPVARLQPQAEATSSPAALPTYARPQRSPHQPFRAPPLQGVARRAKSGSPLLGVAIALLVAGAAWFGWHRFGAVPHPPVVDAKTALEAPQIAAKEQPFTNSLGMKFVPVPGTKVLFCIHETRYRDYAAYAAETASVDGSWKARSAADLTPEAQTPNDPVMNVSWQDAQAFCAWLSKKEGKTYRLPTDQEWSCAVGIGQDETWTEGVTPETVFKSQTDYPWGKEWPPPKNAGNFSDTSKRDRDKEFGANPAKFKYIDGYTDGYALTAPVMSFTPNHLGLYDMSGNVWEWVQDWWNPAQQQRVLRGGCWDDPGPNILLSSSRAYNRPDVRHPAYGFRVALVAVSVATSVDSSPPAPSVAPATAAFTNTLGMKFVPVPGTKVLFSIYDTRVKDFAAFVASSSAYDYSSGVYPRTLDADGHLQRGDHSWKNPGFTQTDEHPVTCVSWEDAQAFCAWLGKKEGKIYRLPTDHEWSVAMGIGSQENESASPESKNFKIPGVYPWGAYFPPPNNVGNYAGSEALTSSWPSSLPVTKGFTDDFPRTSPVGSFKPNLYGLYDMGGNVWQWCEDWMSSKKVFRTLRGGSWFTAGCAAGTDHSWLLMSSCRGVGEPSLRQDDIGFRVVLVGAGGAQPVPVAQSVDSPQTSSRVASATKAFTNTLGMKFVPVPGTKVLFCIHDTRNADYAVYAQANNGVDASWKTEAGPGKDQHPVVFVSWDDAKAFCAWLSKKEGKTYRLPTDHEWSVAVGIGDREDENASPDSKSNKIPGVYPWGGQFPPGPKDGNYNNDATGVNDGYTSLSPVMKFNPNRLGLYDMGSNVWQWCEDRHNSKEVERVSRGGSSRFTNPTYFLSSSRHHTNPSDRIGYLGFRVVLVPVAPAPDKTESEPSAKAMVAEPAGGTPAASKAATPAVPELAAIEQQFVELQAERVTAPFEADVAKLNTSYLGGIDREMAQEKAAGRLATVLTLEAEKKRVADKQSMPGIKEENTSKEPPPEELKKLRAIYRESYVKLEILRASNIKALTDPLTLRLQALQLDLTKQKRIADAQAVMLYRQAKENLYRLAKGNPFVNSLGMKFVPVPGTKLLFCIHDTRNGDYAAYAQSNKDVDAGWKTEAGPDKDQHPVVNVSWEDANAFCAWLSKKESTTYRLPTDHEWSIAVGIGSQEDPSASPGSKRRIIPGVYPWGVDYPPGPKDGNYNNGATGVNDGYASLAPVMQFKPNHLGLYDMGGNVWQLCEDPLNGERRYRVMRGGSYQQGDAPTLLSSFRGFNPISFRGNDIGFRVVLEGSGG